MTRFRLVSRMVACLAGLGLVLAATLAIALMIGPAPLSLQTVLQVLAHPHDSPGMASTIVLDIRLPRALLAMEVGAALSLAGAAFQGLLRNPLADPYIVGTSAGAALGGALSVLLAHWIVIPKPPLAFVAALLTMVVVYQLAQTGGRLPVETFLLSGVVVGSFLWAFVSFILTIARTRMQELVFWLMGDLSAADLGQVLSVAPYLVLGSAALFLLSHTLNLMTLGEDSAFNLGVSVEPVKLAIVAVASLLTAAAVSVSGLIGFVGLMVPHLTRSITGPDHRILLPASALAGAAFLVLADTLARSLVPDQEIPVGVITALLGGPFFLFLLRRRSPLR